MIFIVAFIGASWWILDLLNSKNSNKKLAAEPSWTGLVDELRALTPYFKTEEQLESYLADIQVKVRNFETDYSFLVAYNSIVRDLKAKFRETS